MPQVRCATKQKIVALYPTHTAKILARQFGISTYQVSRIMHEAGATKNRRITDDARRDITRAYANGESIRALAKRYGVNRSYITVVAKEGGAFLRQPRKASTFFLDYLDSGCLQFWGS
jgi:transposase-like protein